VVKPRVNIAATTVPDKRLRASHLFKRDPDEFYLEPHWVRGRLFDVEDFDRRFVLLDPCVHQGTNVATRRPYEGNRTGDGIHLPRPAQLNLKLDVRKDQIR
jgi:hypothetical protein